MRFIDEAKIRVLGGHGGPGCVSFRRETFIPRGGPDGGDGGDGGNITFQASDKLNTLQDFRFKRVYQAPNGIHGSGANKAGRDGLDILIRVPVGTVIKDTDTSEILIDFMEDGQDWVACHGGRGGKGNTHFTTSTHQAPKFAQPGEEGESRSISLELKLIADVGIIGFPNAGKSTLISRMSAARPKIADYPFTTLTPNLGVVSVGEHETFVAADIPGLVEGAHRGIGLGHRFLKHIERTRIFIHLLDGTQLLEDATQLGDDSFDKAVENLVTRYQVIRNELGLFSEKLLHIPEIIVLNKLDILESDLLLVERARKAIKEQIRSSRSTHSIPGEPFVVSAVSGTGVQDLIFKVHAEIKAQKAASELSLKGIPMPNDERMRS